MNAHRTLSCSCAWVSNQLAVQVADPYIQMKIVQHYTRGNEVCGARNISVSSKQLMFVIWSLGNNTQYILGADRKHIGTFLLRSTFLSSWQQNHCSDVTERPVFHVYFILV
jgi:hypothetical protein